jgi:hypothetical protein
MGLPLFGAWGIGVSRRRDHGLSPETTRPAPKRGPFDRIV